MIEKTAGIRTDHFRKPDWLRIRLPSSDDYSNLKERFKKYNLNTICESGNCPNLGECWSSRTATFMILGNVCTRNCRFCGVRTGKPESLDPNEPLSVALAIRDLGIKHCVITSVTRDDLHDGGASVWKETVKAIHELCPATSIETLIPDFNGNKTAIKLLINSAPDIISHNMETVRRLTPLIRVQAQYERSIGVLEYLSGNGIKTKSGIMVGLGETDEEVLQTMDDLLAAGCKIITIGQYLQPTRNNHPVVRFVNPEQFNEYEQTALKKGFVHAECKPLVRSSYHAEKHI